ncbi:hypothetical protein [Winogradskya humida]|uniref:Uncharacterized protein n=1 Tax=Winogradskya humida TaxID=113566 RepID=A0ABQ4A186_9ACTN|nr:hypothetical protein [Actinoplanes humidus]GIE24611.1 hypothetical protein Ahu01nite_077130 [Actinoplanes humidus]
MSIEGWVDPSSHWIVTGEVDSSGKMTNGSVNDNVGSLRDRNKNFSSKSDFAAWVKRTQAAQRGM